MDSYLRKWNSSEAEVLSCIPSDLKDALAIQSLPAPIEYTKTLGIEWNSSMDHFCLTIANLPPLNNITKRVLVSDVAKTFNLLGWFSPTTIKVKILFQRLWEQKVGWDDLVDPIYESWFQWRSELHLLCDKHNPQCYFDKKSQIASIQLHGFSDASENAYAAVVYLRMTDTSGRGTDLPSYFKDKGSSNQETNLYLDLSYVEPTSWHNYSPMSKMFSVFSSVM